ncbi:MAG: hypothetical protein H6839_03695 [Planctomycetes bacterium]|nr:hypothetical protein [Planctomycetota bacterium]
MPTDEDYLRMARESLERAEQLRTDQPETQKQPEPHSTRNEAEGWVPVVKDGRLTEVRGYPCRDVYGNHRICETKAEADKYDAERELHEARQSNLNLKMWLGFFIVVLVFVALSRCGK